MNKQIINLKPDYRLIRELKKIKDRLLYPLILLLNKWQVTPDMLTVSALLMIIPIALLFQANSWLVILFILFNILFDSLDGSLARFTNKQSNSGAFLDLIADHFFLWCVLLVFIWYDFLSGFWPVFYLFNYIILTFTLLIMGLLKIPYFFIFKNTHLFYLIYFVYLISDGQFNWFNPYFLAIGLYMFLNNIALILKLKNNL